MANIQIFNDCSKQMLFSVFLSLVRKQKKKSMEDKTKKTLFHFKDSQLAVLDSVFIASHGHPSKKQVETIVGGLGCTNDQVSFKN